jgi:hypothetical integral membrane protein (TIGR02206 family)
MEPLQAVRPFAPFGLSHDVVIVVVAVVAATLVALGRRYRGTPIERRLSSALALVFGGLLVAVEVYWLLPWQGGIKYSLPLQLCDLAAMAGIWGLWSYSSTAFALTYFWGLTLTSQAFVSPELTGPDFPSLQFFSFFGVHSLVLCSAVYLTWGVGLRPDWLSYRTAVLITIAWGVAMFAINRVAGTYYGFLNRKPTVPSLLDALGPWPWYLLFEVLLGAAAWALITWPWVRQPTPRNTRATA